MESVHALVLRHGVEAARAMASTKAERLAVDAAASVMGDEDFGIGISHPIFAMTALPHRAIEEPRWRHEGRLGSLAVESGVCADGSAIGVPFGVNARLILLYLQTQALRTRSREVELGGSIHAWMQGMGLPAGGRNYKLLREQAWRISLCRLTFSLAMPDGSVFTRNAAFVRDSILPLDVAGRPLVGVRPMPLWRERVVLEETFFESLDKHGFPLRQAAIRALARSSSALDVYVWLAYRLHCLRGEQRVSWTALRGQFGQGFRKRTRDFKPHFRDSLGLALAAYPEARVDLGEDGAVLRPSKPPVPPREERANLLGFS